MFAGHDQIVFELLAGHRLADPASLQAAFDEHQATGRTFAAMVLELGLLDKPALLRAVADHLGCGYAADLPDTLPADALALVDGGMARTYGVAPVAADGFSLTLLAVDPFNPNLVSDLTFALEREVHVVVADPDRVALLIRQHYGEEEASFDDALSELQSSVEETGDGAAFTEEGIEQLAGQTPIIRFVNLVLA